MPVPTLAETKHFLRVDHSEDDGLISSLLISSKTLVEEIIRVKLETYQIVPEPINQAILILVGTMYEERQVSKDSKVGISFDETIRNVRMMLFPYRQEKF